MKQKYGYFLGLTGITGLLLLLFFSLPNVVPPHGFLVIAAFYFITGLSHFLLIRAVTANPNKFQTHFLGAMAFKMFAYLVFLALVHFLVQPINLPFVLTFFVCYLVYTTFELLYLQWMRKK